MSWKRCMTRIMAEHHSTETRAPVVPCQIGQKISFQNCNGIQPLWRLASCKIKEDKLLRLRTSELSQDTNQSNNIGQVWRIPATRLLPTFSSYPSLFSLHCLLFLLQWHRLTQAYSFCDPLPKRVPGRQPNWIVLYWAYRGRCVNGRSATVHSQTFFFV